MVSLQVNSDASDLHQVELREEAEVEPDKDKQPLNKHLMTSESNAKLSSSAPMSASNGNSDGHSNLSLVDKLIDSELEWRQLIKEANGGDAALNELGELQIKRQEVIHELVQTERHHCLTLALMRQVYLSGLRQLNESRSLRDSQQQQQPTTKASSSAPGKPVTPSSGQHQLQVDCPQAADLIDLERLFPALEELVQAHELFFAHLRLRLVHSCQRVSRTDDGHAHERVAGLVGPLGELLCEQFRLPKRASESGASMASLSQQQCNGLKLLQAYAKFCGQHYDSSRYYKHLMQTDKGFKQFIEVSKQMESNKSDG